MGYRGDCGLERTNIGAMSRALLLVNPGWRAVVATNLNNTSRGMLVMKQITSSMPICQKQVLAEQLSLDLCRGRGLATTSARLSDDKKAAEEAAAAEKAAAEKAAAEKAAAEKAVAEKAAAEKAAAEKAAKKAAAEKAAAEEAAAEKAAAEKAAVEKAAAEKAAAEKAAADAAAEAAAIANMRDPIQELFLTSIRAYGSSGGLAAADAAAQDALQAELERVARQYGIAAGEDVTAFPKFEFKDEPVDPISISQ